MFLRHASQNFTVYGSKLPNDNCSGSIYSNHHLLIFSVCMLAITLSAYSKVANKANGKVVLICSFLFSKLLFLLVKMIDIKS